MYIGIDPVYLLLVIPVLIAGMIAQGAVTGRFKEYSQVASRNGFSGVTASREILRRNDIENVKIEMVRGTLSDHYDPRGPALRLSSEVANEKSIAAIGVAAHECGHALQDARGYWAFGLRGFMVPAVQFGSSLGPLLVLFGLSLNWIFYRSSDLGLTIAWIGIILYAVTVVFSVVTLPVELDASRRANQLVVEYGIVDRDEAEGVRKVLSAAAWTYVIAAMAAIVQLLYWVGVLARRSS